MVDSERTRLYYQAMSHLTTCRKSLEDNAEAVKAGIRDSVAKQIEAMRRREQWLIQQVELVQADQTDQLRRQERCLQKTLTTQQTLQLPLMPAEPPLVSFTAESAAMHEAISQYGRIVCGYAQSPSTFSSATPSLPGPVEEYEEKEDEAWEHKSLSAGQAGNFLVRLPRTPPKLVPPPATGTAAAVASIADSFEVLSAGSLDEDKTRWLINYVCKANEPCHAKSDCLCDGSCFKDEAKIRQELGGCDRGIERWLGRYQPQQHQQLLPPLPGMASPPQQELLMDNWKNLSKEDWLANK